MGQIFISHSKRDKDLVDTVSILLRNIGHGPIFEELLPINEKNFVPSKEIREKVGKSDVVFIFLTDNVVKTSHTRNWVIFEDGLASATEKRVFLFERKGTPIEYPVPYVTDYMVFDPANTKELFRIQEVVQRMRFVKDSKPVSVTTGSAATMVHDGKNFEIVSGLSEFAFSMTSGSIIEKRSVRCHGCNESFSYWSPWIARFRCPCCRKVIKLER